MTTKTVIEGLTILEKYREKPDGYNTGAEHDQIYAYATDKPVDEADLKRLVELGWFQEDAETGDEEFGVKHYDADVGWTCYV